MNNDHDSGLPEGPDLRMLSAFVDGELPPAERAAIEAQLARQPQAAARVAAELGADWVKIPYASSFQRVTKTCYVPAVILGGAKKGSEDQMLRTIDEALDAGARGVAIGRNIFQADDPAGMTAAVAGLVHGD